MVKKTIFGVVASLICFYCLLDMSQATLVVAFSYAASHEAAKCITAFIMHIGFMWACSWQISFMDTKLGLDMDLYLRVYFAVLSLLVIFGFMLGDTEHLDNNICGVISCAALYLLYRKK